MGIFLNSIVPFEQYKGIAKTRFFVDKSLLIEDLISAVTMDGQQYFCITRPRRFGKTVMANMIGAFFGKASNAASVFERLKIAQYTDYQKHLNQYDIIYIDFSRMPENCTSYDAYISRISHGLKEDLLQKYPALNLDITKPVRDNLHTVFEKTQDRFIFVMDEWDAVFHKDFITDSDRKKISGISERFAKRTGLCAFRLHDRRFAHRQILQWFRDQYV